jgi:hypothetical protein
MASIPFDRMLGALMELPDARRRAVMEHCERFAFHRRTAPNRTLLMPTGTFEEALRRSNTQIVEELRRLYRTNSAHALLQCARRIPPRGVKAFLEGVWSFPIDGVTHDHIFSEQALLSANFALEAGFSSLENDEEIVEQTLLDGISVAFLCSLHRMQTVVINTSVREGISSSLTAPELIDSYVRRTGRHRDVRSELVLEGTEDRIVGLTLRTPVGPTALLIEPDEHAEEEALYLNNYLPLPRAAAAERRRYGWLDHPWTSSYLNHLPFERWWECWLLFNRIALEWLPQVLGEPLRLPNRTSEDKARIRLCFEIHNFGMATVDLEELRRRRTMTSTSTVPSVEEWDAFLESVTWSNDRDAIEFVERPYVFYPLSGGTVIWDMVRQGGVLPALARKASRGRGGFGEHKGDYFEALLHHDLTEKLPPAAHLRGSVEITEPSSSRSLMQIDHSFIIGDVLILLEAKLQGKRIDYYLTAEGFENRVKDRVIEKWLNNRDRKLRDHHALVARA